MSRVTTAWRQVWRSILVASCVFAVAWSTGPARAQLPSLGDGSDLTVAAERKLGDRIAREIYRDPEYVDDALLGEYLESIWRTLLVASRQRGELTPDIDERFAWEVMQIRDRTVNAFALPGGYMGVHWGLVGVVASRDELASVLAHELSHITQRHIARMYTQQGKQTPWLIGAIILGAMAAGRSIDAAQAAIVGSQALAIQNQLNFSRDMEREADRIGYNVMTQAGYESAGFVTMFEKLQQASRLNDNGSFPYLRSHPLTSERIADMQLRLKLDAHAVGQPIPVMEHLMLSARARVLANASVDALRAAMSQAQASVGGPQISARRAADLYAGILAAMRQRDFEQARAWLDRLSPVVAGDSRGERLVRLLDGELALAMGQDARAIDRIGPIGDPPRGRPELLMTAQALGRLGRLGELVSPLQSWMATHPRDQTAQQMLAQAYGAAGQTLRAIRTEAELQVMRFDYQAAVDRLKAAQDLVRRGGAARNPGDHIEASIIDTRLREVESLLREQRLER